MSLFSRRNTWIALAVATSLTMLANAPANAKDLQGRVGLGYNAQWANINGSNAVPAVSLKYAFTRDIGGEADFGLSTATPHNSVIAAKLFKNLFYETNLNFYFLLGGGAVTVNYQNAAQFLAGFGAEFFIPGVESLGFSMETGASMDNTSGSFAFKTMGISFLNAGMHFYF